MISLPPGVTAGGGAAVLIATALILSLGIWRNARQKASVIPRARRVALYQEAAWRAVLLFSVLDFSWLHVSQETRFFPWPNVLGLLLLCAALVLPVRGARTLPSGRVRFPQHLASMLRAVGFPTALSCGFGILYAAIFIVTTYFYRMDVEDDALTRSLGAAYVRLVGRTDRLIPWVY